MARPSAALQPRPISLPTTVEGRRKEGHRDTIEAIVVAFILALVVRGFEAQAFVIPTGSMAPTLMGRHKEIACPQCGYVYAVNASEEVELRSLSRNVYSGICVNCRYQARLDDTPSFKGDRILVMMFPYDLPFLPGSHSPERWDVVVFRYPEEPEVSYIKRLVGLPGETIRIQHGDVYVKSPGRDSFVLARKPLRHQSAMQIDVYDDRHRPRAFAELPGWQRWQGDGRGWEASPSAVGRYETAGKTPYSSELRYTHLVPDPEQWDAVLHDRTLPREPRATLITDFYSYNTNLSADASNLIEDPRGEQEGAWMQPHWVGDLTLAGEIEVKDVSPGGSLHFELIKAGVPHRCTIDLATGATVFTRGETELGRCDGPFKGPGRFRVEFANVDGHMTLVVNGRPVGGEGFVYNTGESEPVPTAADRTPAAIVVTNAGVAATDLVLKRDIYYTQYPGRLDYAFAWDDHYPRTPMELFDLLSDPARYSTLVKIKARESLDYPIGEDRYFMLGDNSPRSKDSRGWDSEDAAWDPSHRKSWEVPRRLLTGKAFYIYWPHGVPFGPDLRLSRDTRVIFRPYFERMKWIR
jgi:signal peptidase I